MKRLLLSTVIAIAAVTAASAEVRTYNTSGGWQNAYGVNSNGKRMCVMSRLLRNNPGDPYRMVFIKYEDGDNQVFLQVAKQSWRIPTGTDVPAQVGFDGQPWGDSKSNTGKDDIISIYIAPSSTSSFLDAVAHANIMNLTFGGNEPQWNVSMDGSRGAIATLARCISTLRPGTQPYGNAATPQPSQQSQPYSSGQQTLPQPTTPGRSSI